MPAVDAPHQIDEVEAGFDIFRRRYVELYVRRHRAYHDTVSTWRREFTSDHATRLNALRLLNEIPELGPPVGPTWSCARAAFSPACCAAT